MIRLMSNDDRYVHGYLNFKRAVTPDPMVAVGPSDTGEYYWPVEISEDGKRVGYTLIPVDGYDD